MEKLLVVDIVDDKVELVQSDVVLWSMGPSESDDEVDDE